MADGFFGDSSSFGDFGFRIQTVNRVRVALGLEKHPDKVFIGRIERGFDFLGYRFSPDRLAVARRNILNFVEFASRLCEQERMGAGAADVITVRPVTT